MFFTGKEKKTGNSKVLSEAEIKKKLYGDYESTSGGTHSFSHEVKMTGPAFESHIAPKRDHLPATTIKSPSFGAASKPEVLVSRASSGAAFSDAPIRNFSAQKTSSVSARSGAAGSDWKNNALKAGQAVLGFLTGVLWKTGSYLIQILDFILRLLDPRKPQARKLLYSITACILVAALFFGVFRLNAQRKKAMMGELRPVAALGVSASRPAAAIKTTPSSSTATIERNSAQKEADQASVKAPETSESNIAKNNSFTVSAPSAAAGGRYVIQVATYAVLEDANRIIQSFNQAGFTAFYKKQIRNSTGHSFYPVYLGRFESTAQAQKVLAKFRKSSVARPFQDSFIRTLE